MLHFFLDKRRFVEIIITDEAHYGKQKRDSDCIKIRVLMVRVARLELAALPRRRRQGRAADGPTRSRPDGPEPLGDAIGGREFVQAA